VDWEALQVSSPVMMDARLNDLLKQAIQDVGYRPLRLVSGAGHDAVPISLVAPVCMLFVRCFKGISHHPSEDVEMEDIVAAIAVADRFIHHLQIN
jgi:allantoate deiminase